MLNITLIFISLIGFLYSSYKVINLFNKIDERWKNELLAVKRYSRSLLLGVILFSLIVLIGLSNLTGSSVVLDTTAWVILIIYVLAVSYFFRKLVEMKMKEDQLPTQHIKALARYSLISHLSIILFLFTLIDLPF